MATVMMARSAKFSLLGVLIGSLVSRTSALDRDMARFAAAKETQARELAEAQTNRVPSIVWSFFDAVRVDDWETATNLFVRLERARAIRGETTSESISPALQTALWPPIAETLGTYEIFHEWDTKWVRRFGQEIIDSVPKNSIYFGGTAAGRYIVSALSESHREGDPFFTLTQNQLADGAYLDYLRRMYGSKIQIPSDEEFQKIFQTYVTDAQARLKTGKLLPGEEVRVVDNRVQVSGQTAVMVINGLLVKAIREKNPAREFYLEESIPLRWMYPYLIPHGLIFQFSTAPLAALPKAVVEADQDYWKRLTAELIGSWLNDKTTVKEVCDFVERVYSQKNLRGFKGEASYVRDAEAQKAFSKLRNSNAALYVWRLEQAKDEEEKIRLRKAADLAFRQAFALCPNSPDTINRYCQFLKSAKRADDALTLAKTCARMYPDNAFLIELVRSLQRLE